MNFRICFWHFFDFQIMNFINGDYRMEVTKEIKLSVGNISEIITNYLKTKNINPTIIDFNIDTEYYGYGKSETAEKIFTGCTVTVKDNI